MHRTRSKRQTYGVGWINLNKNKDNLKDVVADVQIHQHLTKDVAFLLKLGYFLNCSIVLVLGRPT